VSTSSLLSPLRTIITTIVITRDVTDPPTKTIANANEEIMRIRIGTTGTCHNYYPRNTQTAGTTKGTVVRDRNRDREHCATVKKDACVRGMTSTRPPVRTDRCCHTAAMKREAPLAVPAAVDITLTRQKAAHQYPRGYRPALTARAPGHWPGHSWTRS
jgi:hypothetical protein